VETDAIRAALSEATCGRRRARPNRHNLLDVDALNPAKTADAFAGHNVEVSGTLNAKAKTIQVACHRSCRSAVTPLIVMDAQYVR
jgi:hypothetical protein